MRVGILGGGESAMGAVHLARKRGYELWVSSLSPFSEPEAVRDVPHEVGMHTFAQLRRCDVVVRSPGIKEDVEILRQLKAEGVPVISEIEWAFRHVDPQARIVAVSGSTGKSTTAMWIAHLLSEGFTVGLGGNLGPSWSRQVAAHSPAWWVVEVSSFQLVDIEHFRPHIAVLTNLVPNHLDWHGSWQAYREAKLKLVKNLLPLDHVVYNLDSVLLVEALAKVAAQKWGFSVAALSGASAWTEGNKLFWHMHDQSWEYTYEPFPTAPENILAAGIVASLAQVRLDQLSRWENPPPSLPHRLEYVGSVGGIAFYDDSKSTTVLSAQRALQSLSKPIVWIAGGVDKGNDYGPILSLAREKVRTLILIGDEVDRLREAFTGVIPRIVLARSMEEAVQLAYQEAQPDGIVLLSPMCSSFDWYRGYQERGQAFQAAVHNLTA
ncbi:MAG: UDP-N-acetylmuramoyl-L-alanine--D-glutamate ligase [Bacteroidia bacterium]